MKFNTLVRNSLLLSLLIISLPCFGQIDRMTFSLSNNTTGLPIITYPQLFYTQFHPGVEFSLEKKLNKREKNQFYFRAHTGIYYHQFVQTFLKLYPSVSYERKINSRINLGLGFGGGYGLSFEGDRAFVKQDNGTYKQKGFFGARSQFLAAFDFGGSFKLNKEGNGPKLTLRFATYMQGPFVKGYVLLLPLNAIQVGLAYPLNK